MTRALSALLLALGLLLTGCNSSQSGGPSNPDNQTDEAPAREEGELEEVEPSEAP